MTNFKWLLLCATLFIGCCHSRSLQRASDLPAVFYRQADISVTCKLTLHADSTYDLRLNCMGPFESSGHYTWVGNSINLEPEEEIPGDLNGESWLTTKYKLRGNKLILQNGPFKRMIGYLEMQSKE